MKLSELWGAATASPYEWSDLELMLAPELIDHPCPPECHERDLSELAGGAMDREREKFDGWACSDYREAPPDIRARMDADLRATWARHEAEIKAYRQPGESLNDAHMRRATEKGRLVTRALAIKAERVALRTGKRLR